MSLSPDQYRFLVASLVGLSLALPYRHIPKNYRNEFHYLPGILMLYYCFGRQANVIFIYSFISYLICKYTPSKYVQRVTMCLSLMFLSYAHLSRQIIDYGGYVLDISGPFMIAFQKMTSLGFCMHDGGIKQIESTLKNQNNSKKQVDNSKIARQASKLKDYNNNDNNNSGHNNDSQINSNNQYMPQSPGLNYSSFKSVKSGESIGSSTSVVGAASNITKPLYKRQQADDMLTDEQRYYAIVSAPKFSEFMGYFYHFPSVLCGPIMYYKDYDEFTKAPVGKKVPPGKNVAVAKKLTISISCAFLHLALNPKFEVEFLRSPSFLVHTHVVIRFYYILIFTILSRLKYYVAWHLGEAISNLSGLGFNGYDVNGKAKWNLISNMDMLKFETCTNLRDAIHSWNKTTQQWLRRTAYERAPRRLTVVSTYLLSAVWHGFYPGYYMTFLGGALFTHASRNGRRIVRPLFQRGYILPKLYDIFTFILTRLTIAYVAFPFVILDFHNNLEIYKSLYFSLHIMGLCGVFLGYIVRRQ